MSRKACFTMVILASMLVAGARASSPGKEPVPGGGGAGVTTPAPGRSAPPIPREKLSPMHREIFDCLESERAQVDELTHRFTQAVLPAGKLSIQKEIEAAKRAGMIGVLEIQLRYARAEGRSDVARQLETTINAVKNPGLPQGSGPTLLEKTGAAGTSIRGR